MKIATISFVVALLSTVSAHMDMTNPMPRGHPSNPNAPVKDYDCISAPLASGCGNKAFPCGGYPPDTAVTQTYNAGQVFNVQFGNAGADPNNPSGNQARHNGGLCEFALSYDDGRSWSRIATYHNTCPDIFYSWPVKIPESAPSCERCLFSWSWINAQGNREFYQNCADVQIVGTSTAPLPITGITVANLPGTEIMTPPGDPANTGNAKGSGPSQADIDANTQGTSVSPPAIDNGEPAPVEPIAEPESFEPAPEPVPESAPVSDDATFSDEAPVPVSHSASKPDKKKTKKEPEPKPELKPKPETKKKEKKETETKKKEKKEPETKDKVKKEPETKKKEKKETETKDKVKKEPETKKKEKKETETKKKEKKETETKKKEKKETETKKKEKKEHEPKPLPEPKPESKLESKKKHVPPLYTGKCIKKNKENKCIKRAPKCLKRNKKGKCVKKEGKCIKKKIHKCVRRAPPVHLD